MRLPQTVSHAQQFDRSGVFPIQYLIHHFHHAQHFLRRIGQEGVDEYGQVGGQLQTEVHAVIDAFLCCRVLGQLFGNDPGFFFLHVFVAGTAQVDHFKERIPEFVFLQQPFHFGLRLPDGFNKRLIFFIQDVFVQFRHFTAAEFVHQHPAAVHEVSEDAYQFAVVAVLEIFPGKIIVLGFGRIGA